MKRLSKKEKGFIYNKIRGLSHCNAVLQAGYNCKDKYSASRYGVELMTKLYIIEAIEQGKLTYYDVSNITKEFVLKGLEDLATNSKSEAIKKSALEALARCLGMEKHIIEGNLGIQYTVEEKSEYKDLIDKLRNRITTLVPVVNDN